MATQWDRDRAIGPALYPAAFVQPIERRRHPQSSSPLVESGFHGAGDSWTSRRILQSQRFHSALARYLRECRPQCLAGSRIGGARSVTREKVLPLREIQYAIPG